MSKLEIKYIKTKEIKPYERNPRKNDEAVNYVKKSIQEFGFKVPIVVDKENVIVCGHTRWKASKELGLNEVPCVYADDLSEEQIKAFRLADNKVSEFAEWDDSLLDLELDSLDMDMTDFGFLDDCFEQQEETEHSLLKDDFIFNPFSVLDGRTGEWLDRKNKWLSFGIKSELGRKENLIFSDSLKKIKETMNNTKNTSVFDPVICELMYKWFNVTGGENL